MGRQSTAAARKLRAAVRRTAAEQHKARLAELRALIASARLAKREAMKAIQSDCAARRVALRESCQARKLDARVRGSADVEEKRAKVREAQATHRNLHTEGRAPTRYRSTAKERQQDSDDAVRRDIPAELLPVFEAVKRQIKGGPRKTRTEEFLEWVHENPDEVWPLVQHETDRELAKLIAEYEQQERSYQRARSGRSAVPF